MDNLVIARTEATPEIHFDYPTGVLALRGESYPENAADFYTPVFKWLRSFLASDHLNDIVANIEILYFNSSSSKVLMNFFDLLDVASTQGKRVIVNWIYDVENESALEYGEEFKEDIKFAEFNLVEK